MTMPPPQPPAGPPPQPPAYGTPPQAPYGAPHAAGPAPGVRYASSLARLIAYLVDAFILGIVVALFYVFGFVVLAGGTSIDEAGNASFGAGAGIGLIVVLVGVVVGILWKPWFWSHGGQTPGYMALGMRVVRAADGGPLSFGTAILRLIGYVISGMVFYLGFIWIIFDDRHQGWHDKIANTVVIQS